MKKFEPYVKEEFAEMRPYMVGEVLNNVLIPDAARKAGSPKEGDMIARNPQNHDERWIVAEADFKDNFKSVE